MIPAAIAATFRTALNARLSMVIYLGEQGWSEAEQEIEAAQEARLWLDKQPVEVEHKNVIDVVHERSGWPDYGARGKRGSWRKSQAWSAARNHE